MLYLLITDAAIIVLGHISAIIVLGHICLLLLVL